MAVPQSSTALATVPTGGSAPPAKNPYELERNLYENTEGYQQVDALSYIDVDYNDQVFFFIFFFKRTTKNSLKPIMAHKSVRNHRKHNWIACR